MARRWSFKFKQVPGWHPSPVTAPVVVLHKMPRGARAASDCFSTFEKVHTVVSPDQISLRVNTPNLKKFKYLTILARYDAKIAKTCNFWTFRLVMQLIKQLFKI